MKRRVAMALAVTFLAAGCGSSSESSTPDTQAGQTTVAEQSTSTEPTSTSSEATTNQSTTTTTETPESTTPRPDSEPCQPADRPSSGSTYAVTGVAADDVLNIREFPGHETAKVGALSHETTGLRPTGICRTVGAGVWWELDSGSDTAWVNAKFLALSS